ncbi:hypothetical protein CR513_50468, partial [Mucuna pruriens]
MTLTISFCIDLSLQMTLPLSSHGSLDRNLMNHDRLQNKSSIGKANRAIDKEASTYYGGSISTQYEKMIILFAFYFT